MGSGSVGFLRISFSLFRTGNSYTGKKYFFGTKNYLKINTLVKITLFTGCVFKALALSHSSFNISYSKSALLGIPQLLVFSQWIRYEGYRGSWKYLICEDICVLKYNP